MSKTILLTGAAGFIGANAALKLLDRGTTVIGVDNMNNYYDVRLKDYRLQQLKAHDNFTFIKLDIENREDLKPLFEKYKFDAVLNFAARAGVSYSMVNPYVYFTTNANAVLNLLELCKDHGVKKLVQSSTSSLYAGQEMPFDENLPVNTPISTYAASKKAAEVTCHTYHYLYGLDITVVRYFTVYGPAGRPDMSIFRFIKWIDEEQPMEVFGDGSQSRDFTYVDDIAEGTIAAMEANVGYEIINLGGGNKPYSLNDLIVNIEDMLGKKSSRTQKEFQKTDIHATWANIDKAKRLLGWEPKVELQDGLRRTVDWYLKNKGWLKDIVI